MTNTKPALTLKDILDLDGEELIEACYREILHREADHEGLASHFTALENGIPKLALIASIASSDEACLSGSALSPLAVRVRQAQFVESQTLPKWLRSPVTVALLWRIKERTFLRHAARVRREAAANAALGSGPRPPAVTVMRVPHSDWLASLPEAAVAGKSQFWFDMTTAFQWTEGVVGIVRAELEMATGLKKVHPEVRFSMQVDQGFVEIEESEIRWLLSAENVVDAYMTFFGRYPNSRLAQSITVTAPDEDGFFHPYKAGDVIFAAGWMDSQKENYFSRLKSENPGIYLAYLVYDIIMLLDETRHFYPRDGRQRFEKYIEWMSSNCDLLLYGGRTAQIDTEAYLKRRGLFVPPGQPVKFGTDIVKNPGAASKSLLKILGITGDFIVTVGSIEPRKNHETLYRAYLLALEQAGGKLPQLVIVGKPMWRADDLMNILTRHPQLQGKILCLRPTDPELAALYENCLFTLLPSLYEGWSLTLPESLGQGKFCLCSETPPLREIGGDLVDYIEPFDVKGWAEKIILYSSDRKLLAERTARVVKEWPTTHWVDTAKMAFDAVMAHTSRKKALKARKVSASGIRGPAARGAWKEPTIWMDLTLSYLHWNGGISGIVRAELEFARHLKAARPDTRFFANQMGDNYFFEVDASYLKWLFEADDLTQAYKSFHEFWLPREEQGTGYRNPFFTAHKPIEGHPAYLPAFPANSIVFFAGIDSDGTGTLYRSKDIFELVRPHSATMTSQLIYDLTPFKYPQFHTEPTCRGFRALFEHVSKNFDHIVYGGKTAELDGIAVQKEHRWRSPPSGHIEFGSDIAQPSDKPSTGFSMSDEELLNRMGITDDFAITVGTIEPRKNHEVLYKAYLTLLRQKQLKKPLQIVFVGKPGWNSSDFLATLEDDDRVRGRILILSPTDEELDVLYRHCRFTLLPSFYEGWSLTLPESLSYGKMCITSDVAPLREIGRDMVEYVHPLDTYGWAESIAAFANDPKRLAERERRIAANWKPCSWRQSSEMLVDELVRAHKQIFEQKAAAA